MPAVRSAWPSARLSSDACARLARRVAEAYLEQRKEMEYPLLKESEEQRENRRPEQTRLDLLLTAPQSLALEIGVEELPAGDVDTALCAATARDCRPGWTNSALSMVRCKCTPPRGGLLFSSSRWHPDQPDREDLVKGPPAEQGVRCSDGMPTPAAMGFAKKNGVDTTDLEVREQDGGKYVFAVVKQKGRPDTRRCWLRHCQIWLRASNSRSR